MTETEIVAAVLAFLVMLVGMAGILVPVLPDVPIIWLAALGYGLVEGFDGWPDAIAMLVLTVLMVLAIIVDLTLGAAGAAKKGASWQAIAASLVGGLIGLLFFPPLGALLGALLGVFIVEYQRRNQNAQEAWEAVKGYAMGCGWSVVVRVLIAIVMIGVWGIWVWVERG
jgi:uncharacterized protein YqgC (DUF456 family)